MHLPWDITDGLGPKKMAVHKHTVHHLIDGRPMRRFAKISSNSYFLLQLLKKFSRCVCQILMKFLLAGPIQRRSSLASSTDLSFLLGAKSLPAVWSFSKYCYTLQMRQRQRQSLFQQILLHSPDETKAKTKSSSAYMPYMRNQDPANFKDVWNHFLLNCRKSK